MIRIIRPRICNIIQYLLPIQPIPFSNRKYPRRSKRSLGINVKTFPFSTAHVDRKLTSHCQSMTNLTFTRTKFSKDFGDGTGFNASSEEGVELLGSGVETYEFGTADMEFCGCSKAHRNEFGSYTSTRVWEGGLTFLHNSICFCFGNALDGHNYLFRSVYQSNSGSMAIRVGDTLDGIEACLDEFPDIAC